MLSDGQEGETMPTSLLAEWDWLYTDLDGYTYLHCMAGGDAEAVEMDSQGQVETVCGLVGLASIPGLFSRMETQRCPECCRQLGWPEGVGSPKNCEGLRPRVRERIAETDVVKVEFEDGVAVVSAEA